MKDVEIILGIITCIISFIAGIYIVNHIDTTPACKKANEAIERYDRLGKTKAEEIEEKELVDRRNWKRKYWTGFGEYNPDKHKGNI